MSSQAGSLGSGQLFDLNSQTGVMRLLAAVRASGLTTAQKNELRDLVFLYTNGGGDATVRRALEQKLATYQLQPAASSGVVPTHSSPKTPDAPPTPPRPFGNSRPAPTFVPVKTAAPASKAAPVPPPPAAPVANPEPSVALEFNSPAPEPVPIPAPHAAEAAAAPTPVPPAAVENSTAPAAPSSTANQHFDRIREIKQAVNQKVGNPVNLVDIDNVVGREYMVALLEAMKKVNGGMPGELEAAMARLETAYVAVEAAIAAHSGAEAKTVPAPQSVTPVPTPAPAQESIESAPVASESPTPPPTPPSPTPESMTPTASASADSRWGDSATPTPAPLPTRGGVAPNAPVGYAAASLAEDPKPLLTPKDLPDPASVHTSEAGGDPLYTKQVDDGLEQLLAEWSIFKKSGLFGTGPKGREHPLFKELAKLTIPIILAGRYEGSSQEIRQSITDYMNGWRYEQGIVYDPDETFEHYLRRVIRHIIDLQKRRPSA